MEDCPLRLAERFESVRLRDVDNPINDVDKGEGRRRSNCVHRSMWQVWEGQHHQTWVLTHLASGVRGLEIVFEMARNRILLHAMVSL